MFGFLLMTGLLIFKTFLVGTFFSSEMRNLSVCSKGGSNLPPLFLLGRLGRSFSDEFEIGLLVLVDLEIAGNVLNFLLVLVVRLNVLSSFKRSLKIKTDKEC